MTLARGLAAAVALATLACPAAAQSPSAGPGSRPAGNHPDWTGYYRIARGADLAGFTPENQDDKFIETDKTLDRVVDAHLQPWARLKLAQTYGSAEDNGAICQLDGIFRVPIRIGGFMWLPAEDKVIIISSHIFRAGARNVFLDRPHPKYPAPTWLGDSIGRWEGDVLVVDTVGFNDRTWLTSSMYPHTEDLHVVERYTLVASGLMEVRTTVEDREALASPYSYSRYYKRTGNEVPELMCNADPGEQRMWTEFRRKALAKGMLPPATTAGTDHHAGARGEP
jgi:hypothetical protein